MVLKGWRRREWNFILCSDENQIYDPHKAGQSDFHSAVLAAFP